MLAVVIVFGATQKSFAQSSPVMYFCTSYNSSGEKNISDRFTTGYLTVMVKSSYALGLSDVSIQFDKLNQRTGQFEYNKKFNYVLNPDDSYVFFSGKDLSFSSAGIYRVFLLDSSGNTVTSALIEII
jgi:hypothetical protein